MKKPTEKEVLAAARELYAICYAGAERRHHVLGVLPNFAHALSETKSRFKDIARWHLEQMRKAGK